MKTSLRTSAALLTLSLALTAGVASAAPAATNVNPTKAAPGTAVTAGDTFSITINGSSIPDSGFQPSGAKEPLIPLRTVAESLGFEISWNTAAKAADLSKGTIFTTVKSGEDRYVINKMYTPLGTAPVTKADRLYVPASFISEVLKQNITLEGRNILVTSAAEHLVETGVITSIRSSGSNSFIQIKGTGTAGVVLTVNEDTVYNKADGAALALADLQIGMTVEAEHAMFSTRSLPPQTPAYRITVQDTKVHTDVLGTQGSLEEIIKAEDGSLSLRIKGSTLSDTSQSEIVLRLGADTLLVNESGDAALQSALVQGAAVIGFYGPVMTRSLPPIGTAIKVVVQTVQP